MSGKRARQQSVLVRLGRPARQKAPNGTVQQRRERRAKSRYLYAPRAVSHEEGVRHYFRASANEAPSDFGLKGNGPQ